MRHKKTLCIHRVILHKHKPYIDANVTLFPNLGNNQAVIF